MVIVHLKEDNNNNRVVLEMRQDELSIALTFQNCLFNFI